MLYSIMQSDLRRFNLWQKVCIEAFFGIGFAFRWAIVSEYGQGNEDLILVHAAPDFGDCHLSLAVSYCPPVTRLSAIYPNTRFFENMNSLRDLAQMPQWTPEKPLRVATGFTYVRCISILSYHISASVQLFLLYISFLSELLISSFIRFSFDSISVQVGPLVYEGKRTEACHFLDHGWNIIGAAPTGGSHADLDQLDN
ncbi:hypothetical protein RHMOL_Rhmol09G0007800 [Rhododendron molle]|uniref:Uncharacterized protein n=1 Tax=Rhododendron molle TaxID=49168 RepID=A0ACC0M8B6_RHOML|nr:hypothetical protein RHMOL_Rhmol09G0007800 [Rhododendron molle]